MEGNKCRNVLWYTQWRQHIIYNLKKIYNDSYFIVMMIKRANDFTKITFSSYNSYGNNLLQYKVTSKCFIYFVGGVNCHIFENPYENIY